MNNSDTSNGIGSSGLGEAALACLAGVSLATCAPAALAGVEGTWQRIVVMSLALGVALLLVASFILALTATMRSRLVDVGTPGDTSLRHLLTVTDALLIAAMGLVAVAAVFLFVLAVIRIA